MVTSTSLPPAVPTVLGGVHGQDNVFLGSVGWVAVALGAVLTCRFALPWTRLLRDKRDLEHGRISDLAPDPGKDDGAGWAIPAASAAMQLRSLAAIRQERCPGGGGEQICEGSNAVVVRQGITPASQLRNFVPGNAYPQRRPRESRDDPLDIAEGQMETPPIVLEDAGPAHQSQTSEMQCDIEDSFTKSPKSVEASAPGVNPALHIREIRSCLAVRQQFRAELESRVADFVQSEELLGSIIRNEKSERQLEERLAEAKEGGTETSPKRKAKGPYMLSVALKSVNGDRELQTMPGQCFQG
mmetsp:Transcript_26926/g.56500  ORF Transcript_26926/g.56500 Transcript_26926/m.56500 type:complete len:299 (-) Transcript_26926:228-1124(-)